MAKLGDRAVGVSRSSRDGSIGMDDLERLDTILEGRKVSAVLHCGWPAPDNTRLIERAPTGGGTRIALAPGATVELR